MVALMSRTMSPTAIPARCPLKTVNTTHAITIPASAARRVTRGPDRSMALTLVTAVWSPGMRRADSADSERKHELPSGIVPGILRRVRSLSRGKETDPDTEQAHHAFRWGAPPPAFLQ